jgi:Fe-S cluster assembly protein SufD
VTQPIHLLFIATQEDLAMHPRNLIRAAPGARATIIEHFAGPNDIAYFTNAVTHLVAGEGAEIEHVRVQQESARAFHVAALHARQAANSRIISHAFSLGALLSRNNIDIRLDAEGAAVTLNGLYVAGRRQHVDHHTRIDHARPRCISRETYKGVLDGAARAVFHGRIVVHPDAQKSDARQSNRNLLLSGQAEVDTRPQLEIHADDVQCAHSATVGQLDEQQLFYLRSRGVDASCAKAMLIEAFAREVIARIDFTPLRERLEHSLSDLLGASENDDEHRQ